MTTTSEASYCNIVPAELVPFNGRLEFLDYFFLSIYSFVSPVNCCTIFPSGIIKPTLTFDLDLTLGELSDDRKHLRLVDFSV